MRLDRFPEFILGSTEKCLSSLQKSKEHTVHLKKQAWSYLNRPASSLAVSTLFVLLLSRPKLQCSADNTEFVLVAMV